MYTQHNFGVFVKSFAFSGTLNNVFVFGYDQNYLKRAIRSQEEELIKFEKHVWGVCVRTRISLSKHNRTEAMGQKRG
jgi:hypothetical protein